MSGGTALNGQDLSMLRNLVTPGLAGTAAPNPQATPGQPHPINPMMGMAMGQMGQGMMQAGQGHPLPPPQMAPRMGGQPQPLPQMPGPPMGGQPQMQAPWMNPGGMNQLLGRRTGLM